MAAYNKLITSMICPRCGQESEFEIEFRFGLASQMLYHMGEKVQWRARKAVQNGGRPDKGTMTGEGYAVCPKCGKDFFVDIAIRADTLEAVAPNPSKRPYIADEE